MSDTKDMKRHEVHDPDLSTEAWERRWDGQKEVKKAARENDRKKLKEAMQVFRFYHNIFHFLYKNQIRTTCNSTVKPSKGQRNFGLC